jgi:hypothetical protein
VLQVFKVNKKGIKNYEEHPDYPCFVSTTPLTYTLLAKACLSPLPEERPTFEQVAQVLADVVGEVSSGSYIDTSGRWQARFFCYILWLQGTVII